MADDRVIHCLFERKHRFSKHHSIPLEESSHFHSKSKYLRKRIHGTQANSPKERSYIENDYILCAGYMQRQKRSKYKQIKNNKPLRSGDEIGVLPLILNSTGNLKVASHYSTPEVPSSKAVIAKKTHSNTTPYKSNLIVNLCCCDNRGCWDSITSSWKQPQIYRCQPSSKQVCCCNCNSDAMFEVMKSLYDCYKNKSCNNCKCVLCGPRFRVETVSKAIGVGEREDIYAELEGKTPSQKERVLKRMAREGYQLPKGRSPSEEAIIVQVKRSIGIMTPKMPSEKIRRARAAGLLTPLKGKSPKEKERILRDLAAAGIPLPAAQTPSEKRLISKVRKEMGLPPEPRSKSARIRMAKAYADGIITPLEGKTRAEKENALRRMAEAGIALPEGRTPSERDLIEKVRKKGRRMPSKQRIPSAKFRRAKAEGILTPLEGKTHEEKEQIIKGLARMGIPLPEAKTYSEKKLIEDVRRELGLPPEPKTESEKRRMAKAYAAGIVTPLEGKTRAQKEEVLRKMAEAGVPLPEGRTLSEKSLIEKVEKTTRRMPSELVIPSEKIRRARAEGLLTPLEGKRPEEKERILRGLVKNGIPLPEGKTSSEKKLINKIRKEMGLPREPQTETEKRKMAKAYATGIITPLEGKTTAQKEEVLRKMVEAGVPLPEGRTASEKNLIEKVKKRTRRMPSELVIPSEKIRRARAEGLLTPLEGKRPEEKERILRGLVKNGIPLPEGKTSSEKKLFNKIRREMGLPREPQTETEKRKMAKAYAAGIITPLEGKTTAQKEEVLRKMAEAGVSLPEGRTPSEKMLIEKVKKRTRRMPSELVIPSEKIRRARAEGLLTPIEGKRPEEKERILRGLVKNGIPLPVGKTSSEKKLINKIRKEMGLPREPQTETEKRKMAKAYAAGIITPLEGKTTPQKEEVLRNMVEAGIPLPEGRTNSERALINKIKTEIPRVPTDKLRRARAEGFLTPLEGKTATEKERILKGLAKAGIPLPEGKTSSERKLIQKVRRDLGLPPEHRTASERKRLSRAFAEGIITPLEGKSPEEKEKILRRMAAAGVPLPEGRTSSERALIEKVKQSVVMAPQIPSDKIRKAQAAGLLTPLQGKTDREKERILRGLAKAGMPLPAATTASESRLIDKVRRDLGLPPKPKTRAEKNRMAKAYADGIITPLEGKSTSEKERVLRRMAEAGVPLPEGRTPSERDLIEKVKKRTRRKPSELEIPSEKLRRVKAEGLLTPLEGKTQSEKAKILRGLAKAGMPLPMAKTRSEKNLIDTIRKDLGLPPEPQTETEKSKLARAYAAGIITPLEGKTTAQKEQILRRMAEAGISLPEGRTASERELISKIKTAVPRVPTDRRQRAKAEGLLTPLENKTMAEKERILRGLAMHGLPLPAGKTASERILIQNIRKDLGLPPEPKTPSEKVRLSRAYAAGIITPLEGKSSSEKERILRRMAAEGIPLPEGRTSSERAIIAKVMKEEAGKFKKTPSERLKIAKTEGFLTPLHGKSPADKERILRGLAEHGLPLPEGKTASEKRIITKVKRDMGLPHKPDTASEKLRLEKAYAEGIVTPLKGKTYQEKEKALRKMAEAGVPLPEGRTASERALIEKVYATTARIPSEKLRKAKAEGLLTPLEGKTDEQKEHILRGLAKAGVPLPEGRTQSEKNLIRKVRRDLGLPPPPQTLSERKRMNKAYATGIITPLQGKTHEQKERILRKMAGKGIPLPEGRTASEKALIKKIKATAARIPSEKLRKAREEGWLTPLEGKSPEEKERILRGLTKAGIPLPEGKTRSEKDLIQKVRRDMGLPPESSRSSEQVRIAKAYAEGIITPLEGKRLSEKERALQKMAEAGIALPEGRTSSEKALIAKVKATTARVPAAKLRRARAEGLLTPLQGKTEEEKEKVLRGLAKAGVPLPEGKTISEKKLIDRVRKEMGLPQEPMTAMDKVKLSRAYAAGIITPLEGKTRSEKEQILRKMVEAEVPLPEGRTASERALINKVKREVVRKSSLPRIASDKLRKARAAGLLTPLEGKTEKERERILRKIAKAGLPLPKAHSPSEQKVIDKVRKQLGLPPEPKSSSERILLAKQYAAGVITPLEGKTKKQKDIALRKMAKAGVRLPEGRTHSEKALIEEIKKRPVKVREALPYDKREKLDRATGKRVKESKGPSDQCICDLLTPESEKLRRIPSGKLRAAKAEGLLTPLEGKSPEQKEKILKRLAARGLPLPEGKTASEKRLLDKVRRDLGLPPEPETPSEKLKLDKAYAAGIVEPLEGKTRQEKEKILQSMAQAGIPLPEGRTASERALIDKVITTTHKVPSEKFHRAKAEGLLTPLEGKTREQKEKILKGLAKAGLPFPELKTQSEKDLADKVRRDLGLPPKPRTRREKLNMAKAYADGIITPLEGKTAAEKERVLRRMAEAGVPLPNGRTASERALIAKIKGKAPKVPAARLQRAKTEGWLTPLEGKTPEQKEKILRGLAKTGIPLPEGKTPSERRLIEKVRKEMGLPPEPTSPSEKVKLSRAYAAGIVTPLEGKSHSEKERILRRMAAEGIPLPVGRTTSEKALINKIRKDAEREVVLQQMASDQLRAIKAEGLLSPLYGKTNEEKERILRGLAKAGVPLPEASSPSERRLIERIRRDVGLPPEPQMSQEKKKMAKAYAAGIITPLEGKTTAQKEKALRKMAKAGIPLPEGRTRSERALIEKVRASLLEKIPSEKLRKAKAEGLLTPLAGKGTEERERILRGLTKAGLPLPEGKTASERRIIQKVRRDMGLPTEAITSTEKQRLKKAYTAGLITPLEGKTHAEKEKILRRLAEAGVPLPEGRTPSEKELIADIKKTAVVAPPSDKIRAARAAGLLTPLEGKTAAQKEEILRGLAKGGLPLPEGKTPSERKLIQKVRKEMGLPPEPITSAEKRKLNKAYAAGIITPLEGKTHAQKEKALRRMAEAGVPLPEGKTASEKELIDKIKKTVVARPPSDKIRAARVAGLLTPLEGKTDAQKEDILRGLAKGGLPLPEGRTSSERRIIQKVRKDMGLPEPTSSEEKKRINKAYAAGIITPLEGKSHAEKEKVLRRMAQAGVPLPEGRTPSERELKDKIKKTTVLAPPSDKIRAARAAGLLTPLEGKTAAEKEEILRGLATGGLPLPQGKTASERRLIQKVRKDMGLPPEPTSSAEKQIINKAYAAGIITPLEGKSHAEKERILKRMALAGVPLPKGRTSSEKELIDKIKKTTPPLDRLRVARAAGVLTPLEGKSPEEKEKILTGLARAGVPLPEGRTASERKIVHNIRKKMGLPPEPKSSSERIRMANAYAKGIITPLEGKSRPQKEKILRKMAQAGIPLPEGRTESERHLIDTINAEVAHKVRTPSEKIQRAKDIGLMTPLEGKTYENKEKILRGLAKEGLPLPKGKTLSEKKLIDKVLIDMGLPSQPQTSSERRKYEKAYAAGIITPLEGKTKEEKEKVLRKMAEAGIELPKGRTASERSLINKVRKQVRGKPVSRAIGVTEEKARAGITEEIEEIEKTTKCDRACGCDRKKIRFKHSYIKIRVTSPDISSFCSCPDECIPGVKGGVFVDNEGIKVTVGRATGTPSYTPSSGSVRTPLSVSSLDFSQSSDSSVAATMSNNYVHSITNMTDVLSNAIFDLHESNSSVKSNYAHSVSTDYNNMNHVRNIFDLPDENNIMSTGVRLINPQDNMSNYQYKVTSSDVIHSQGDIRDHWADKNSITSVHSQWDINSHKSENATNIEIKKITPASKSWIDLLSPRSFVTNSSSYDSIIILLSASSSSSYMDELGTISIVSLENNSESCMIKKHVSKYYRDISQESEHFKRAIDYTVETNHSNTYSQIQDYYTKKSSYNIKQTNYTRIYSNDAKNIENFEKSKMTARDAFGDRAIVKSLRDILSQREFTDTSSICVIMSSDDANSTPSASVALSPLIGIKECRSPNHTKVKSGLYVQNLPQRTENTTTSTRYYRGNADKNNMKGKVNPTVKSTNNKMKLHNNVNTSIAEVNRDPEFSNRSHKAENQTTHDRQTSDDRNCTSKYTKSKLHINACSQGFDINIAKELSRKEPQTKYSKKAKTSENNYHTINKLKKLIFADKIDTGSSVIVLEGTGTKDKPLRCRQHRKHRKAQVPDTITLRAMQEDSSSQDHNNDYRSHNYSNRDRCNKMQQPDIKTQKHQDQGWQAKLCKHCHPQPQVKESPNKRHSRNRSLDLKMSSSRSVYPVFTETGIQCAKKDGCCACKLDDYDVIVIDFKEDKATCCDKPCTATGLINQISQEFLHKYAPCPLKSPNNTTVGHRTCGGQTMPQGQPIQPQAPKPCSCVGTTDQAVPQCQQNTQNTKQSKKPNDIECQCPTQTQQTHTTQTQDSKNAYPNDRICSNNMQTQEKSQCGNPACRRLHSDQNTQTPFTECSYSNAAHIKSCNCCKSVNYQQQTTTQAIGTCDSAPTKEIAVGPDHTTYQPCRWKPNHQSPCQDRPIPSTPTHTAERSCICPEPQIQSSPANIDDSCPCPEDDLIYTYDDLFWLNKKDIMKLKSDLAQTKTGFKFTLKPKMVEVDMSVEDAIEYYKKMAEATALEQCNCQAIQQPPPAGTPAPQAAPLKPTQPPLAQPNPQPKRTQGTKTPQRFLVTCECPPSLPNAADVKAYPASGLEPSAPYSTTPVTSGGFSVTVPRKGYASPMYNNICCYEALDLSDENLIVSTSNAASSIFEIESNSSSLYLTYYDLCYNR